MIFRQLFDPETSTYTYLVADETTREAALVDPVLEHVDAYVALLDQLGLRLVWALDTHVHADHVTGAGALRERLGAKTVVGEGANVACADVHAAHGQVFRVGDLELEARLTPGHTSADVVYVMRDRVFTGDTLFIGGCGRTDFQQGDAGRLYDGLHANVFSLPPDTLVYPGHDYKGDTVSTVKQELAKNPRLGGGRTRDEFVRIMDALDLPYPKHIDRALPANQACGTTPQG
ncbi:MAG: MBL fold metallo-hydrolase [Alphaproteobacteria bacterium]|nr:MBL fold metallo-hydrolase [Alphaproteobacteria bacterium]